MVSLAVNITEWIFTMETAAHNITIAKHINKSSCQLLDCSMFVSAQDIFSELVIMASILLYRNKTIGFSILCKHAVEFYSEYNNNNWLLFLILFCLSFKCGRELELLNLRTKVLHGNTNL